MPLQSWAISLSLGSSSAVERGDSNLAGFLRFEFCDPCVVPSQASVILVWCHPRPGKDMSVPVVSALCSFSRLWAGASASADSGGHGVGRAGRKVAPKGEDTWGRHLAGRLRSRAAPGSRPDWLAQICAQHPWAKMEDLQSMGSDGARELRVGVGPRAWGNQAQDCACLCWERTRAQPLGCEARGPTLPSECSQGFDSPVLKLTSCLSPAVPPSFLTSPQTACDGRVL